MKKQSFKMPYIGIDDNKIYSIAYTDNGDGSIVIGLDNPIVQYSADQDGYYDFHSLMNNIIKLLGAGYAVQKQDIFTKKKYTNVTNRQNTDYLETCYQRNFEGRIFKEIKTYLVITQIAEKKALFTHDAKRLDIFLQNVTKILELLKSRELKPHPLSKDEIRHYIKQYMSFNFSENTLSFDNIKAEEDYIQIGEQCIKSISLIDIDEVNVPSHIKPYRELNLGFLFPMDFMQFLHTVPCETLVFNQIITIPDQRQELNKLEQKKKRHSSMPDPANQTAVADIEAVFDNIAKENQLLVYGHYNVLISAFTPHEIQKATNFIESALFELGVFISKNAYNQLELFRTGLIGNVGELKDYDKFMTTSDAAICFLFKERLPVDEKSNFQIRFCDRQGVPIAIDTSDLPMETNRINNRNKFVLGPSGSGKSFFMNHF